MLLVIRKLWECFRSFPCLDCFDRSLGWKTAPSGVFLYPFRSSFERSADLEGFVMPRAWPCAGTAPLKGICHLHPVLTARPIVLKFPMSLCIWGIGGVSETPILATVKPVGVSLLMHHLSVCAWKRWLNDRHSGIGTNDPFYRDDLGGLLPVLNRITTCSVNQLIHFLQTES